MKKGVALVFAALLSLGVLAPSASAADPCIGFSNEVITWKYCPMTKPLPDLGS